MFITEMIDVLYTGYHIVLRLRISEGPTNTYIIPSNDNIWYPDCYLTFVRSSRSRWRESTSKLATENRRRYLRPQNFVHLDESWNEADHSVECLAMWLCGSGVVNPGFQIRIQLVCNIDT